MTSTEWLTSTDPAAMLAWLTSDAPRKPSARQLRLFAVACYYAVWDRLTDPRSRRAVEVAELPRALREHLAQWQGWRVEFRVMGRVSKEW